MENSQQDKILQSLRTAEDNRLHNIIILVYGIHQTEVNKFLRNWQKVYLEQAVSSYFNGRFDHCRHCLEKAISSIDEISQDSFTVESINKRAGKIKSGILEKAIYDTAKK